MASYFIRALQGHIQLTVRSIAALKKLAVSSRLLTMVSRVSSRTGRGKDHTHLMSHKLITQMPTACRPKFFQHNMYSKGEDPKLLATHTGGMIGLFLDLFQLIISFLFQINGLIDQKLRETLF